MLSAKNMYGFREILFEYKQKGRYILICALDPDTALETSVLAPAETSLIVLKRLAARKLRKVVDKEYPEPKKKSSAYGKRQSSSGWDVS